MGSSTTLGFRYPFNSDQPRVWEDMQELATDLNTYLTSEHGVFKARGKRTSNPATLTSATEAGIYRFDTGDVGTLKAGRAYSIRAPRLRWSSTVATDHVKFHIRLNTAGTATTSSAIQGRCESSHLETVAFEVFRYPSVDEPNVSILLSWVRTNGSGTITLQGVDENGIDFVVQDCGPAPAATGTAV